MINEQLLSLICHEYSLPINGLHGINHWKRVYHYGRMISKFSNANIKVVELFAFLHDSKRISDGSDNEHGERAANFAVKVAKEILLENELKQLIIACKQHSLGFMSQDITIQACWDADRLDLWRFNIQPNPDMIGLELSKKRLLLAWSSFYSKMGNNVIHLNH